MIVAVPHTPTFVTLLLTVFTVCGCATAPPRLPTRGEDVTEGVNSDIAEQALRHLFTECPASFVTARALVRGTRDCRHVVGSLWMGVDATTSSVRLESMDTGSPRFALFGSDTLGPNGKDEATLLRRADSGSCGRARAISSNSCSAFLCQPSS